MIAVRYGSYYAPWRTNRLADKLCVALGIIIQAGRVLIAQRKDTRAFPGTWEFPGGKFEPGDADLRYTLRRELHEELGIDAQVCDCLLTCPFPHDQNVELNFFKVVSFTGTPALKDHTGLMWIQPFDVYKYNLINPAMFMAVGALMKRT